MRKINISSRTSFIVSIITSIIFVLYFAYKGFVVYFVQKAMDDTFVGGGASDITITLWFGISLSMALSMFLFFQFIKIKDLKSQRTIQKGIFIGWAIIAITMTIFVPSYKYLIIITILSSIVSFLSSVTLKDIIAEKQILVKKKIKKNTSSKFFSYLVVSIISFVALIILIDTLKVPLINVYPDLEILLFNLFEILKDIKLFIIDLY